MTTDGPWLIGASTRIFKGGPPPDIDAASPTPVALGLQEHGIKIIPTYGLRRTAAGWVCQCRNGASKRALAGGLPDLPCTKNPGKHPRILGWPEAATLDRDELLQWHRRWSKTNFSAVCGRASRLWVLDVDGEQGFDSLARLEGELGPLPPTWRTQSGSGVGRHYWFALPDDSPEVRSSQGSLAPKVDVRGHNGQILVPGSLHKSGNRYRWEENFSPSQVELAIAPPAWVRAVLAANKKTATAVDRPQRHRRDRRTGQEQKPAHTQGSSLIGDGPERGGFHGPINLRLLQYFGAYGADADEAPILDALRQAIEQAPVVGRSAADVERYLSDDYLIPACDSARTYIKENAH